MSWAITPMHQGTMPRPSLPRQGPVQGVASAAPVLKGSGTCPSMERAGPGGALRHGARTKLPSSCPVFWATRTMRWCASSERASGTRRALTDPLSVGQSAGDGDTGAPRATAEGLTFNTLLTQMEEKRSKATESHMEQFSLERVIFENTFRGIMWQEGLRVYQICLCDQNYHY